LLQMLRSTRKTGPGIRPGSEAQIFSRFYTERERWCWFFGAIDHGIDELPGWHVAKHGDRWAALAWECRLCCGCHGCPGSQRVGFDQGLAPNVTIVRVPRTDARVIACGHTHLPEVRDLGWKLIVNAGSVGYVFDGDPTASWASGTIVDGEIHADIRRATYDVHTVANAISARGLPGDVYRAATVRTGKLVR